MSTLTRMPRYLVLGLAALFALVLIGGMGWHFIEGAAGVRERLDRVEHWMTAWRWLAIAVIGVGWRYWVEWLGGHLEPAARANLIAARWQVVGWMVVLELLLAQNLVGQAIEVLL
ncbi:hypothetical protein [Thioalkalivibrio sp. ALE20]|uniref:hypothetical protein n=1 Tax=Thioalkalivibrio sp. ALE20 TaxID=545275 RepID=UPI000399D4D3|nr:hypothetical protein [Thioalkalivibrio sp. ALE20]